MLSRISYAFRETWASFQRNVTLTGAAVVVAAVALMFFGLSLLIQNGFGNLLTKWQDGVEMIVYLKAGATQEQIGVVQQELEANSAVAQVTYLDQAQTLEQANKVLAGQPSLLKTLTLDNIPSQLRVKPAANAQDLLPGLKQQLEQNQYVVTVALASDTIHFYSKLSGFVRTVTIVFSVVLLVVALVLIWTTIRTAMFARRREIEVMKLVGATNWFIRIPFMLEGLIQGLIGGLVACGGLATVNLLWTNSLKDFGTKGSVTNDLLALQVSDTYLQGVMLALLVIGAAAGAIGAGVAASRFLDV